MAGVLGEPAILVHNTLSIARAARVCPARVDPAGGVYGRVTPWEARYWVTTALKSLARSTWDQ
ncbi:hypothetical protein J3D46_000688 [Paenarthrobacter sp. A20]|nr:hypothetical protein [Paenarthrobacter sp. A20]